MPRCESCGQFVSSNFVRVFGTNEGDVYGCPECLSQRSLYYGEASRTDA